jgi:hypothetical protein
MIPLDAMLSPITGSRAVELLMELSFAPEHKS